MKDRVHFLNTVTNMPEFYNAIDVCCLPSLKEGLPLVPLEAQACGKPVVVTDVGSANSTVDPVSGLVVPAADSDALVGALRKVLQNKSLQSPRAYIAEQFNLENTVRQYEALYQSGREF